MEVSLSLPSPTIVCVVTRTTRRGTRRTHTTPRAARLCLRGAAIHLLESGFDGYRKSENTTARKQKNKKHNTQKHPKMSYTRTSPSRNHKQKRTPRDAAPTVTQHPLTLHAAVLTFLTPISGQGCNTTHDGLCVAHTCSSCHASHTTRHGRMMSWFASLSHCRRRSGARRAIGTRSRCATRNKTC